MRLALLVLLLPSAAAAGTLKGTITFKGDKAPHSGGADRSSDTYCATTTGPEYPFEVHDHKIEGAYVRIANGTFKDPPPPSDEPVVITQSQCEYSPRLLGMREGQRLEIHNDDPTFHNVRVVGTDGKIMLNKPQQKGAAAITTDAVDSTGMLELHCDVHSWMQSTVIVADHPYWAITGADGSFSFTGLKPGKYKVEAWVPDVGWKTTTVRVKKGKKAAKANLQFDLDDCGGCSRGD